MPDTQSPPPTPPLGCPEITTCTLPEPVWPPSPQGCHCSSNQNWSRNPVNCEGCRTSAALPPPPPLSALLALPLCPPDPFP